MTFSDVARQTALIDASTGPDLDVGFLETRGSGGGPGPRGATTTCGNFAQSSTTNCLYSEIE